MTHSPELDQLVPALIKAQSQTKPAKRNATDDSGKSFADLASVLEAAKRPLRRNGLAILQFGGYSELTTVLLHTSGQFIAETAKCEPRANGEVGYGARWAVMRILGMRDEPMPDGPTEPRYPSIQSEVLLLDFTKKYGEAAGVRVRQALFGLSPAQQLVTLRRFDEPHDIIAEAERLTGATK